MPKGRNAQYAEWLTEDGLLIIRGWARDGLTDKQIAKNIGVAESTFKEWKRKFDILSSSLKKARIPAAYQVEEGMMSRTEWRKVVDITRKYVLDDEGNRIGGVEVTEHEHWVPPDSTIMIFTSKNLMPHKYRDKPLPPAEEQTEDDGLLEALTASAGNLFESGDDSQMVTEK